MKSMRKTDKVRWVLRIVTGGLDWVQYVVCVYRRRNQHIIYIESDECILQPS